MTDLRKPVSRVTDTSVRFRGQLRRLVVTLLPGDVIELRPQGCRQRYVLPLDHVYSLAVKAAARALVEERKKNRKTRRTP